MAEAVHSRLKIELTF